jgi:hypothetical protein
LISEAIITGSVSRPLWLLWRLFLIFWPFILWQRLSLGGQLAGSFIYVVRHRIEHRHGQLMKLDPVFQMSQDKMIPVIAFGTSFKVEILLCKH